MSLKTKHSKIRNTGILFELLTRQITVDVLNNSKKGSAAKILKEFFNKKTQLGKEYELYRVLTVENYTSEIKANHLVDAVVKARQKLNNSQFFFLVRLGGGPDIWLAKSTQDPSLPLNDRLWHLIEVAK